MKKTHFKFKFLSFWLILGLLAALAACGGEPALPAEGGSTDAATEAAAPAVSISLQLLQEYTVVRPDAAGDDLAEASVVLLHAFRESLAPKMAIATDFYKEGVAAFAIKDLEILIGPTGREETAAFMQSMKSRDYGYGMVGKKLVIAGGSEEASIKAVELFTQNVLKAGRDGDVFFSPDMEVIVRDEYAIDRLSLGGKDLSGYRIIYANANKKYEKIAAEGLGKTIADCSGFVLPVLSDIRAQDPAEKEILIGLTNRDKEAPTDLQTGEGFVGFDGTTLRIYGENPATLMGAVHDFTEMLANAPQKDVTLNLEQSRIVKCETPSMTAMTFNILVKDITSERAARVIEMVKSHMPDTVGFQEASPTWMNKLQGGLNEYYACVGEGRDGGAKGEYNPIFYNKMKFKLLESGTRWLSDTPNVVSKYAESSLNRIYTYALLERLTDGAQIMVINTHFEHTSEDARKKQAVVLADFLRETLAKGYPLILTGDFNTTANKSSYATVVGSGVANASDFANSAEKVATFHNYGSASSIIDFIFLNSTKMAVESYHVCNEKINGDYASDHHPVFISYQVFK